MERRGREEEISYAHVVRALEQCGGAQVIGGSVELVQSHTVRADVNLLYIVAVSLEDVTS